MVYWKVFEDALESAFECIILEIISTVIKRYIRGHRRHTPCGRGGGPMPCFCLGKGW